MNYLKNIESAKENVMNSVNRFGEIPPLWQNCKSLWQFSLALFSIWQNVEHTLKKCVSYWIGQVFFVVNGQTLEKLSSHLVTLVLNKISRQNFKIGRERIIVSFSLPPPL